MPHSYLEPWGCLVVPQLLEVVDTLGACLPAYFLLYLAEDAPFSDLCRSVSDFKESTEARNMPTWVFILLLNIFLLYS